MGWMWSPRCGARARPTRSAPRRPAPRLPARDRDCTSGTASPGRSASATATWIVAPGAAGCRAFDRRSTTLADHAERIRRAGAGRRVPAQLTAELIRHQAEPIDDGARTGPASAPTRPTEPLSAVARRERRDPVRRRTAPGGRDARPAGRLRRAAGAVALAHRATAAGRPDGPAGRAGRRVPRGAGRIERGQLALLSAFVDGLLAAHPDQAPGAAAAAAGAAGGRRRAGVEARSRGGAAPAADRVPHVSRRGPRARRAADRRGLRCSTAKRRVAAAAGRAGARPDAGPRADRRMLLADALAALRPARATAAAAARDRSRAR